MKHVKRKSIPILLIGSLGLVPVAGLTGCEDLPGKKGTQGAVIGGAGGAAAGAAVGGKDNRLAGALIGGILGAGGGYLIGHEMQKKDENEARDASRRSQEHPATAADVRNSTTADLNRDGFVSMDEVIAMKQAGLSDQDMVQRLQATGQVFELAPDQQQQLRNAGLNDYVLNQMLTMNRAPVGAPSTPPPPTGTISQPPPASPRY